MVLIDREQLIKKINMQIDFFKAQQFGPLKVYYETLEDAYEGVLNDIESCKIYMTHSSSGQEIGL